MGTAKIIAIDRRSEPRTPCDFSFSIVRKARAGGLAHSLDLSSGGMRFCYFGEEVELDERVLVQFTLDSDTFSFCGAPVRVSASEPFAQEVAVRFLAVDGRTRSRLENLLWQRPVGRPL